MRHCYVLRVFTRGDDGGNHLGVITDVTGLHPRVMQEIAADLGFSETIFIDWREPGHPSVRIFTPALELPFAGHPLVGAGWVLSGIGPGTATHMVCGVGEIPFRMQDDSCWVDTPVVTDVGATERGAEVAAAAGLPTPQRSWWVNMPVPYLVLEAGSAAEVTDSPPPWFERLVDLEAGMTYLFFREGDEVTARFFAPAAGVDEDPATGSAAAALAAVLRHEGEVEGALTIRQGDQIGHPSTISLRWDSEAFSLGGAVRREEVRVLEA